MPRTKKVYLSLLMIFNLGWTISYSSINATTNWTLTFYKKFISPLQGKHICNFSPTCSQFYRQGVNKYGFVIGSLMGADRLLRCNPWAWNYLDRYYYGIQNDRINDPPENHYIASLKTDQQPLKFTNPEGESGKRKTDRELDFADYLFQSKDYLRAVAEYKRLLFFYPDSQNNSKEYVRLMLGECYLNLNDYEQAINFFQARNNDFDKLGLARAYFLAGDYEKSRKELQNLKSAQLVKQKIILIGWSYFKERKFSTAAQFFQNNLTNDTADNLIVQLAKYDGRKIKHRSRVSSTLLSAVLPGLGQIYAGRFGDGLYSFLTVVGSGLIANYYYYHDESKIKFSLFGFLTAFFYSGNVYGANIAARDYNEFQTKKYQTEIEKILAEFNLNDYYKLFNKK